MIDISVKLDKCKIRIMIIYLGRKGGGPLYAFEMTKALKSYCEIGVVISGYVENIESWRALNIPLLEIRTYNTAAEALFSYLRLDKFYKILNFVKKFKPDIIYYPMGHLWKPVLDVFLPREIPVVYTVHDPILHLGEDSLIHRVFDRLLYKRVDFAVVLSEKYRSVVAQKAQISEDAVLVLPHGIFDHYTKMEDRTFDNIDLGFQFEKGEYYLFLGRLVAYKGLSVLLKAYSKLLRENKTTKHLVIAGSGELTSEEQRLLSSLPSSRVFLLNRWLSDREISTLLKNAFALIAPYTGGTQSGVIPAAYAFGVPVIASDCGGLPEQVIDGQTGLIFETGNYEFLALQMERLENTPKLRDELSKGAINYANQKLSWSRLAKKFLDFITPKIKGAF